MGIHATKPNVTKKINMDIADVYHVKKFIYSIIQKLNDKLDKESVVLLQHYLNHDEYEMAFEGLFIEIMKMSEAPKIDINRSKEIGRLLKLDEESIFEFDFWERFDNYTLRYDKEV
jgi:hypothetical protein